MGRYFKQIYQCRRCHTVETASIMDEQKQSPYKEIYRLHVCNKEKPLEYGLSELIGLNKIDVVNP